MTGLEASFSADQQDVMGAWAVLCDSIKDLGPELEAGEGPSPALVRRIGSSLAGDGWFEVAVPGSDLAQSITTLVGVAETGGLQPVPLPYPVIETWLAIWLLDRAGAAGSDLLEACRQGDTVVTVAVDQLGGAAPAGRSGWIPWGHTADVVLVPQRREDGGVDLHAVTTADVELRAASPVDPTAPGAWFDSSALGAPVGTLDDIDVRAVLSAYLALQAGEMIGCADRLLRMTGDHLRDREQFGRRLASFQALTHRAADMFVALETARSLTYYAAWCVEVAHETSHEQAMMAKGFTAEAATHIGDEAIQLHGAYGFTWEAGLHYSVRRILHRSLTGRSARACQIESGRLALQRGTMLTLT